jgi:hypothetical protein
MMFAVSYTRAPQIQILSEDHRADVYQCNGEARRRWRKMRRAEARRDVNAHPLCRAKVAESMRYPVDKSQRRHIRCACVRYWRLRASAKQAVNAMSAAPAQQHSKEGAKSSAA